MGAPYHWTLRARIEGRAAHAGVEPEEGVSAIQIAAAAVATMPLGRIASQVVSSTVMSGRTAPDSTTERTPSKMAAIPALSSADRMVRWAAGGDGLFRHLRCLGGGNRVRYGQPHRASAGHGGGPRSVAQ